jgi:hypothetical protein
VIALVWFPISYLTRFIIVVLIEPCLNPVKLPICSIAAKFIYPVAYPWLHSNKEEMSFLVYWLLGWFIFFVPDAFGFLFWEIKENWKLYRANRGKLLRPAVVGARGETLCALLRPGFHSGTVPRLYRRLRAAEEEAERTGNFSAIRACQAKLQEVEEAVRLFVSRELLVLLEHDDSWRGRGLSVGRVHLTTNTIHVELRHVELRHTEHAEQSVWLRFEEHSGRLSAGLSGAPWIDGLAPQQRHTFQSALAILYKLAGVDVLPETAAAEERLAIPFNRLPMSWEQVVSGWASGNGAPGDGRLPSELALAPPQEKNGQSHHN